MPVLTCPLGHRFKIPRVVYGDPMPETMDRAARGEVTLGGRIVGLPIERPYPECGLTAQWWSDRWSDGPADGPVGAPEAPI